MRTVLKFSLAANLGLLVLVGVLELTGIRMGRADGVARWTSSRVMRRESVAAPASPTNATPAVGPLASGESFHWSQIEAEDYHVYIANLRRIGCPEATVRDLVVADVNDLFSARVKALVDAVTGRFWELFTRGKDFEELVDAKQKELRELREQRDEVFTELFGEASPLSAEVTQDAATERRRSWERLADYLPAEKRARWVDAKAGLEEQWEAFLNTPDLTDEQRSAKRKELEQGLQATLRALLTPEELAELQLRESGAAGLRHRLEGLELSESETRLAAQIQFERDAARPAKREPDVTAAEASLRESLGPERWAAFQRALDARFDPLYRLAQRLELPTSAAVEAFNIRCTAEAAANQLRAGGIAEAAAQRAALEGIAAETRKSLATLLGAKGLAAYERGDGEWLREMAVAGPPVAPPTP